MVECKNTFYLNIFMAIMYIVQLVMMFILLGLSISTGTGTDTNKQLAWAFYGFAIVTSMVCVASVIRSGHKRLVYWGMSVATVIMFALIGASIAISKPEQNFKMSIITYTSIATVFILNAMSLFFLTRPCPGEGTSELPF